MGKISPPQKNQAVLQISKDLLIQILFPILAKKGMAVRDVMYDFSSNSFAIKVYSPGFPPVPEGRSLPRLMPIMFKNPDGVIEIKDVELLP